MTRKPQPYDCTARRAPDFPARPRSHPDAVCVRVAVPAPGRAVATHVCPHCGHTFTVEFTEQETLP